MYTVNRHLLLLFVARLTSQQHVSVSQGRVCSGKCTCCHTEIEVADRTFYLTQSQYTDTGPTISSADPISSSQITDTETHRKHGDKSPTFRQITNTETDHRDADRSPTRRQITDIETEGTWRQITSMETDHQLGDTSLTG